VPTRDLEILVIAADLFFKKSYEAVTVDQIGAAAGLTGPAIYRHFKSKGDILAALFDQAIDGMLSATGAPLPDPVDDVTHLVSAHADFVVQQHTLASVWIREGRSLPQEHRSRLRRRERAYIARWTACIQRCHPDLSDHDAQLAALTALGTLNATSSWPKAPFAYPDVGPFVSEFVLRGLKVAQ
jgi:AcrR family transcriptional regulator